MNEKVFSVANDLVIFLLNTLTVLCFVLPNFLRVNVFRLFGMKVGKAVFLDVLFYPRYPWRITIDDFTTVNRGFEVYTGHCTAGYVSIGSYCAIAPNVHIYSAGHDPDDENLPITSGDVIIGNKVWVGADSTILQGVTIGEGAVVAAGSLVCSNVQPYSVVAGRPARLVRMRNCAPAAIQSLAAREKAAERNGSTK